MDSDNDDHPFPFKLEGPSVNQDPHAPNPMAVENLNSFATRNLHSSSGYGGLNQDENNTTPRMEGIESAIGGLSLSNTNTVSIGLHSGPHDNETNLIMNVDSYMMRIRAATEATELVWSQRNHINQHSLEFVRRRLVSMAKDHCGYRLLQKKIDDGRPEEIEIILSIMKYHLHELMIHPFGNYLIQKIFQANSVSVDQMNTILELIIVDVQKLTYLCMDNHGTQVVQKMLENLRTRNQISAVTNVLKRITVILMKNLNGGYVIQQCLKLFPFQDKMVILDEVAKNCLHIATDRCGCSVIQKCLSYAEEEAIYKLIPTIILNAAVLAVNPYGNYVVQYIIKMEKTGPSTIVQVIEQLRGIYVELSTNKYASNVVEDLLQFSKPQDAATIVIEMMNSPEFLDVVQDPFGNYVAQKALQYTKGPLRTMLCKIILSHYRILHSDRHGKEVLKAVKRCFKGITDIF